MDATLAQQLLLPVALALAVVPWLAVLGAMLGARLAAVATMSGGLISLVAVMILSSAVGLPVAAAQGGLAVLLAVSGAAICVVHRARLRRPSGATLAAWLPATLGSLVWLVVVGAARAVPGASAVGWAMNGDAFNNLYYARRVIATNGLQIGGDQNPVPMPSALLSLAFAPFGPDASVGTHLERDVVGMAVIWTALLAVGAVVMGAVVASLVPPDRIRTTAVVSALGSLLTLTWFVAGLPMQWGYINVHVALPLALGCWLAFRESARRPVGSLVVLCLVAVALLATWSPLVVIPAGVGAAVVVVHIRMLRSLPTRDALPLVASVGLVGVWVAASTVPALVSQSGVLAVEGHGFPAMWPSLIAALALVCVAGWRTERVGSLAVAGSAVVGSGVMLFLARAQVDPITSYYPSKFSWLMTVVVGAVALACAVGWLTRSDGRVAESHRGVLAAVAVAAALAACVVLPPASTAFWADERDDGVLGRQPVARILGGTVWNGGDTTAERIFAYADPDDLTLEWHSGDPDEAMLDFWVLVTSAGGIGGDQAVNAVAFSAYQAYRADGSWDDTGVTFLCAVLERLPGPATVRTADPEVAEAIALTCATQPSEVVVESAPQP